MQMKFTVSLHLLSECSWLFYHSLSAIYENQKTKCSWQNKCSFGEILSQRLTASPYMELVSTLYK